MSLSPDRIKAVDLFAGPGGWDVGARDLGIDPTGVEFDDAALATRRAAGLHSEQGDVANLDPDDFAPCDLLIASPPCQAWSTAGVGGGKQDIGRVWGLTRMLAAGKAIDHPLDWADPRSRLVIEPLRWVLQLRPAFVAWEQVPPVLGYWELCADVLRGEGYSAWTGIIHAVRHGVPQTRKRAILIASTCRSVGPPTPTHQPFVLGEPQWKEPQQTLEGELLPWVSMADALGWGMTDRPYPTLATSRSSGGPDRLKVGGASTRAMILREKELGRWRVGFPRRSDGNGAAIDGYRGRDFRAATEPSHTISGKGSTGLRAISDDGDEVRLGIVDAGVLQGFAPDYPWRGTDSKQFQQIGNAVPPPVARVVLASLTGTG